MSNQHKELNSPRPMRLPRAIEVLMGCTAVLVILTAFLGRTAGMDALNQEYWLHDYSTLVLQGTWIPRWIPNGFHGLGSPSFYFYPPLAFWLAAPLHAITHATTGAALFQAVALFSIAASFFFARILFLKINPSKYWGTVAAIIYAISPYTIAEWYSQASISSIVSFMFIPLFVLGILRVGEEKATVSGILLLGFSMAGIFLSSVPVMLLVLVSAAVAGVVLYRDISVRMIWLFVSAGILFLLLVSFQISSILQWQHTVQLSHLANTPEYAIASFLHFRVTAITYYYTSLYVGFGIVASFSLRSWKKFNAGEQRVIRIFLILLLMVVLLEIPIFSRFLWLHAPILHLIQGAWRFYIVLILLVSMIVAMTHSKSWQLISAIATAVWSISTIVPLIVVLFHIQINPHYTPDTDDPPEYATIYSLTDREAFSAMVIRHSGEPSVMFWDSTSSSRDVVKLKGDSVDVALTQSAKVTFHRLYWPSRGLWANDKEVPTYPDSIGRVTTTLPEGNYIATWKLERTPWEVAGLWISFGTLVGTLFTVIVVMRRRRHNILR